MLSAEDKVRLGLGRRAGLLPVGGCWLPGRGAPTGLAVGDLGFGPRPASLRSAGLACFLISQVRGLPGCRLRSFCDSPQLQGLFAQQSQGVRN